MPSLDAALKYALAGLMLASADAGAMRGLAPPGLYEIEVTREGPTANVAAESIKVQTCLSSRVIASGEAFLSRTDEALKACPITDVRFNNEELLYRTACADAAAGRKDAPSARAKFVQTRTGYEGSITIAVGDTKKKITERHRAQRIGECAEARSPHVMGIDAQEWRERRLRGNW